MEFGWAKDTGQKQQSEIFNSIDICTFAVMFTSSLWTLGVPGP